MNTSATKTLSLKARMNRISRSAIILLSIALGIMAIASYNIHTNMNKGLAIQDKVASVRAAETKILEITLTSMDIIVDKNEGQISKNRQIELDQGFLHIDNQAIPILSLYYNEKNDMEKLQQFQEKVGILRKKSLADLKAAVESRSEDEVFAELDDTIDKTAAELTSQLNEVSTDLQTQLASALAFSDLNALIVMTGNIILFFSISIGTHFLMKHIEKSIVSPLESISTTTVDSISRSANELRETASHLDQLMLTAADNTTQGAQKASLISSSVENVAAAVEELASSIGEIRRQANISNEVSTLAVNEAKNMSATIKKLNAATEGIGEITDLINKIAESTNLLALNATIEAARAGEAGKGFAVVATEVKNLAVKTAEATSDISTKIIDMQNMSKVAVAAIGNIQETISEINNANSNVMASVEQQSVATEEITKTLSDATDGLKITSDMICGINETIQETKNDSNLVLSAAEGLLNEATTANRKTRLLIDGNLAA